MRRLEAWPRLFRTKLSRTRQVDVHSGSPSLWRRMRAYVRIRVGAGRPMQGLRVAASSFMGHMACERNGVENVLFSF